MSMRVHDLAAEFGVTSDELLSLLREMDIFVRSHLSALEEDKVARLRARVERDKRKAAKPEPAKGRRRAATKPAKEESAAPVVEVRAKRRRRTAAEVAVQEAAAAAQVTVVEPEVGALFAAEISVAEEPTPRDVEALFPPELAPPSDEPAGSPPAGPLAPAASLGSTGPFPRAASAATAARVPFIPGSAARPASARPRPVASAVPGAGVPPRPVASAAPGSSLVDDRRRDKKKRKKGGKRWQVDQEAVAENVARTLASIRGPVRRGVRRREDETSFRELEAQRAAEEREREKTLVRVNEFISVAELAEILKVAASQIVAFAFKELGMMITVNQRLDFDQIELICSEFGFHAVREAEYVAAVEETGVPDAPETLVSRPPVVTVMGHVDHGKTSLLDFIRKANVIAGEAGGITQHIGAYHVRLPDGRQLTFLDTPGHEAFTAMRARGAQVTDIVVLVVAADDQVMPQTVEAISHARNAGVPMVVAINKIDLPTADVDKVKRDLLQQQVVLEEFGGTTLATPISAKKGVGIEALLDQILLQAELLDLKANPARVGVATVLEAQLDPGRGPVATVLVTNGTLRVGDNFICGMFSGRVRALHDERGRAVPDAGPSTPVQVLGFEGVPQAGDFFTVLADSGQAREIAQKRQRLDREAQNRRGSRAGMSLEEFFQKKEAGGVAALRLIIKADQGGPAEALADALSQLSTAEVRVEVVHRGVGAVGEGDVLLAKAAGAIIIGFHVRPDANARAAAEREHVDIRQYRVIYEAIEDVKSAMEGMLKPEQREVVLGDAEVKQLFRISGVGVIAGCYVRNGVIPRAAKVRVLRDGVVAYEGALASLRRFKDDVKEVKDGLECGIGIENFNDVKVGDVIEAYRVETVARSLETAGPAPAE
ncbi:MAG: translation initiation factor IF-2 [Gemmatimonadetes bacterium]|nr:translation initiation factor IF-2 [Gemmatimonadota bacterium]